MAREGGGAFGPRQVKGHGATRLGLRDHEARAHRQRLRRSGDSGLAMGHALDPLLALELAGRAQVAEGAVRAIPAALGRVRVRARLAGAQAVVAGSRRRECWCSRGRRLQRIGEQQDRCCGRGGRRRHCRRCGRGLLEGQLGRQDWRLRRRERDAAERLHPWRRSAEERLCRKEWDAGRPRRRGAEKRLWRREGNAEGHAPGLAVGQQRRALRRTHGEGPTAALELLAVLRRSKEGTARTRAQLAFLVKAVDGERAPDVGVNEGVLHEERGRILKLGESCQAVPSARPRGPLVRRAARGCRVQSGGLRLAAGAVADAASDRGAAGRSARATDGAVRLVGLPRVVLGAGGRLEWCLVEPCRSLD
mmetsp:Transcript_43217/g.87108  ORF Transcript_43217/g.87108 Transcript_43217/m.87108 type:complete len:363 (-) Transcript_43217:377-1465(-)